MKLLASEYFGSTDDKFSIFRSHPEDNKDEHSHEFDELVIVTSGHGFHILNNKPFFIKKGDIFFIGKNERHYYDELGTLQLINILINPFVHFEHLSNINQLLCYLKISVIDNYRWLDEFDLSQVISLAEEMFTEHNLNDTKFLKRLNQESKFYQLITLVLTNKDKVSQTTFSKVNAILNIVQTNCFEPVNWNEVSEHYALPKRTMFRSIKSITGLSPDNFVKRLRLISARKIIRESDNTITDIAYQCGFSSNSHFSDAYKDVFNLSPSQERNSANNIVK